MIMKNKYKDRDKAFLGALIAGGISLASAIGGAIANKKAKDNAEEAELEAQKEIALQKSNAQKIAAGNQTAASLTNAYADAYQNEQNFRNRFYKMGGRRKCGLGLSAESINSIIKNTASSLGNLASTGIMNSGNNTSISAEIARQFPELQYGEQVLKFNNNKANNTATYLNQPANQQFSSPVLNSVLTSRKFRCGGRRRS